MQALEPETFKNRFHQLVSSSTFRIAAPDAGLATAVVATGSILSTKFVDGLWIRL
jgi:hypothetical protein